ncbi:hypothetical protein [Gynuella sp.]|uniref:hypothetical protein n=1 Tax=Gynuella sp. TaxID=2969146 RepID=UPI003D1377C7
MNTFRTNSGLPDVIDAFHEALRCYGDPECYNWSHPAVYKAACLTGFADLRNQPPLASLESFKRHYEEIKRQVLAELSDPHHNPLLEIERLSRALNIEPFLLYYLTKPKGTSIRRYLRHRCISQLAKQNINYPLPQ